MVETSPVLGETESCTAIAKFSVYLIFKNFLFG